MGAPETVHALLGCRPNPLAAYLKALGVLRVVSRQFDPGARGFWRDDVFHLLTRLDEDALLRSFAEAYAPTPLLSPWNGGSGFYAGDQQAGIAGLEKSKAARFSAYRDAIARARSLVGDTAARPEDEAKARLLARCRADWGPGALDWLDAAVSLSTEGDARYPSLLGTGGNDGRLEFSNNFMQRIVELFDPDSGAPRADARTLLEGALFGRVTAGLEQKKAIGQFSPGAAGGANASADGFDAESLVNPWDYVLMLEGVPLFRVAALRRLDGAELAQAAAPFAFTAITAGSATGAAGDDARRGEQWLPIWRAPATLRELERLFEEGRVVRGVHRADRALDAARAVALLGVARGIDAFARYGFIVRNGLSNLAVPLDRVETRQAPMTKVRLLDELDGWLTMLARVARGRHAPAGFAAHLRRIEAVAYDLCVATEPGPAAWALLLEALGEAEDRIVRSARFAAEEGLRPLPRLSARWAEAADDGTVEFRLARALAFARAPSGRGAGLGPVRAHCMPLEAPRFERFRVAAGGLARDPRVVWRGADLVADLVAIVERRLLEGAREGIDGLPIVGPAPASLADIAAFVCGQVDDARIARLARGLMAVEAAEFPAPPGGAPLALWALFRATNLDASPRTAAALGAAPRCDAQSVRLLGAGRLDEAGKLARVRLGALGHRPKLSRLAGSPILARRIAASLAFPMDGHAVRRVLDAVARPFDAAHTENP
jgi:CRISPR-associated protein Csx17